MGAGRWWWTVLAAVVLVGCEEPYDAGVQAFDAGQWDKAISRLERVSPFHLNYKDAQELIRQSLYKAGEEAFDNGRWNQAVGYFRQTAESDPKYATVQDRIGVSFYELARQALARGDVAEALRLSNIVQSTCSQFVAARDVGREARRRLNDPQEIASNN